jgi:hypothetical protein
MDFTANSRLAKVVSVNFADRQRVCAELCETPKQAANLSVHQDGGLSSTVIPEILATEAGIAEISGFMPSQRNTQKQIL